MAIARIRSALDERNHATRLDRVDEDETPSAVGENPYLDRFKLMAPIGRGGMGEVWLAHDTRLGREVSIKALPRARTDEETLRRFKREIRNLAALNHPAIAQIYEAGEAAWPGADPEHHVSYLVMEYVEGELLSRRLDRGPLSIRVSVGIICRLLEGLADAHDRLLVHRDIKPGNIIITDDGGVKLLDLGLARLIVAGQSDEVPSVIEHDTADENLDTDDATLSRSGMWIGTPKYMSPEQVAGKKADARADIWAVGLVLYEMLTGRRAIEAETAVKAMLSVTQFEPDWSLLPNGTPPRLIRVIDRCLQQDRRRRYHHARDLLHDLQEVLSRGPGEMGEQGFRSRLITRLAMPLLILITMIAVAVAGKQFFSKRPAKIRHPTQGAIILPYDGESPALTPRGDRVVFVSPNGGEIWVAPVGAGNPHRVFVSERQVSNLAVSPDGREIFYDEADEGERSLILKLPITGGTPVRVTEGWAPAVSPNGNLISYFGKNEAGMIGLYTCRVDGKERQYICPLDGPLLPLSSCYPPGGSNVLVSLSDDFSRSELRSINLRSGETEVVEYHEGFAKRGLAVLPDGGGVLWCLRGIASTEAMVGLSDLETGGFIPIFPGSGFFSYPSLSSAGSVLLVRSREEPIELVEMAVDPGSGSPAVTMEEIPFSIGGFHPRTSPDTKKIVFSATEWDLWVYDRDKGESEHLVSVGEVSLNPSWSPNGTQVVYSGLRDGQSDLWVVEADGSGVWRLTDTPENDYHPCWHPGGRYVFWICEKDGVRNLHRIDIHNREVVKLSSEPAVNPAVSPDGRYLAFVSSSRSGITLFLHRLTEEFTLGPVVWQHAEGLQEWAGLRPRFSPNGRWLGFDASRQPAGADIFVVQLDRIGSTKPLPITAFPFEASTEGWWDWIGSDRIVVSLLQKRGRLVLLREADLWVSRALVR